MDVEPVGEGLLKLADIGDMGEDAQLDLGVVEGEQRLALGGDEGLADAAAFLGADGDVLQVRVGRGEAAGAGAGLDVGGVDAAGIGVDVILQRVGVGGFQLGELAPVEDAGGELVHGGEVFEHVGAGGIGAGLALLAAFERHLVEEDFAELLRRADVELAACQRVDLLLELGHLLGELAGHAGERVAVDLDAVAFHLGQHRHEGAFEGFVDGGDAGRVELRLEDVPEAEGDIGILGGVAHGLVDGDLVEGDGGFAGAEQLLDGDGHVREVAFGERVHPVVVDAGIERVGHQHRVVDGGDAYAVLGEDLGVVFHVLADLEDGVILEDRFEGGQDGVGVKLPLGAGLGVEEVIGAAGAALGMAERDVAGLSGRDGEGDADEGRLHLVERGRFGVDGDMAGCGDPVDPDLQRLHRLDVLVGGGVDGGPVGGFLGPRGGGFGDDRGLDVQRVGDALGQRTEFHLGEELHQGLRIGILYLEVVEGEGERRVAVELDEALRQLDLLALLDQGFAALGLLDFPGAVEQFLERAEFVD